MTTDIPAERGDAIRSVQRATYIELPQLKVAWRPRPCDGRRSGRTLVVRVSFRLRRSWSTSILRALRRSVPCATLRGGPMWRTYPLTIHGKSEERLPQVGEQACEECPAQE